MGSRLPWMKFDTGEWLTDEKVSLLTASARGIWIDAISVMHRSDRCNLTGTPDQLARACRCTADEMRAAIAEIKCTSTADVHEHSGVVTLVSRRRKRELEARELAAKRQSRHRSNADVTLASRGGHAGEEDGEGDKEKEKTALPPVLDVPEFKAAWEAYGAVRRENKWPKNQPTSIAAQLRKLATYGPKVATAAVMLSVENGWRGIFPEKVTNPAGHTNFARPLVRTAPGAN